MEGALMEGALMEGALMEGALMEARLRTVGSSPDPKSPDPKNGDRKIGVLVMAHGTPATLEDLEDFVTELRRGRPPEPHLLAELERRYLAIGGASPLAERTRWHADSLSRALEAQSPSRFVVELGYKFAAPRIEESVSVLARVHGVERAIGIVLAPHYSAMSVGDYAKRAEDAGASLEPPVAVTTVQQWHLAPGFVPLMAELVRNTVSELPEEARIGATVIFTAHSLPERIIETGDPYPEQLRESPVAIAAAADLERFTVAWQSAGRSSERWLGPDVLDVIADLAMTGAKAVIVCPVGFVSEHLEVLYDLDVEARAAAERAGLLFSRTPSLDGDERLSDVLAGVVLEAAEELGTTDLGATDLGATREP
jgi:protoporphyrin/coproporphyrin ferrochelatase